MRKMISMTLVFVCVLLLAGCGTTVNVKIDIGESRIFTADDRNAAAQVILQRVDASEAIKKLYRITYAGDEESEAETAYYSNYESCAHDEIIVFKIVFRAADGARAGGFNPGELYTDFSYMLGRNDGGAWEFVTAGYA